MPLSLSPDTVKTIRIDPMSPLLREARERVSITFRWISLLFEKRKNDSIEPVTDNAIATDVEVNAKNTEEVPVTTATFRKKWKKETGRKWNDDYIKFGFWMPKQEEMKECPQPRCLACPFIASNEGMVPSKLKRHLVTCHPNLQLKERSYFESLADQYLKSATVLSKATTTDVPLLRASFRIAHLIAKKKGALTLGEDIVKPATIIAAEELFGSKVVSRMKEIPLSNNTITRRVSAIADDLKAQISDRVKDSPWYGIQFDETTDVTNRSQLICYVRFVDFEAGDITEDFFFLRDLGGSTTGAAIAECVSHEVVSRGIASKRCSKVTTDGDPSMVGVRNGAVKKLKEYGFENIEGRHCDLHRENLAAKKMSGESHLQKVMLNVVGIINEIKAKSKKSRMFQELCEEMGESYRILLYHCEVRWLTRGLALTRVFDLRKSVLQFLLREESKFVSFIKDPVWMCHLGYLSDIFNKLNVLNRSLQGRGSDIIEAQDKIEAFQLKIPIWQRKAERGDFSTFPNLEIALTESVEKVDLMKMKQTVSEHLTTLGENFQKYFPIRSDEEKEALRWIVNPFTATGQDDHAMEKLVDLQCDSRLREAFTEKTRTQFWVGVLRELHYKELGDAAIRELVAFHSSYNCEEGFSQVVAVKSKKRNSLSETLLGEIIQVALTTSVRPDFTKLERTVQEQKSH